LLSLDCASHCHKFRDAGRWPARGSPKTCYRMAGIFALFPR
jgi:hypothetical protein